MSGSRTAGGGSWTEPGRAERLERHEQIQATMRDSHRDYWRPRRGRPPVRRRRTPLEYGIMCVIARAPLTGSEVCRLFRRYPLAGTGKSPGAVYPALYRLEEAGLVCGRPRWTRTERSYRLRGRYWRAAVGAGPPVADRGTVREFGLTGAGVAALGVWASRRVTRREVLERPEHLMLRFVLCTGLAGPTAARRVALQCRRVCRELAAELAAEVEGARGVVSPGARLALECARAEFEVRVEWSRRAEAELARQAAREPELDLPWPAREVGAIYRKVVGELRAETRGMLRWPLRDGLPPVPPTRRGVLSLRRPRSPDEAPPLPDRRPGGQDGARNGVPDGEDTRRSRAPPT